MATLSVLAPEGAPDPADLTARWAEAVDLLRADRAAGPVDRVG
ncbi:hypothetical protein Q5530_27555 [Saccharothrix sp. BKS2]